MSDRPADDVMSLKVEESPIAKGANALAAAFRIIMFLSLLDLSGAKSRQNQVSLAASSDSDTCPKDAAKDAS